MIAVKIFADFNGLQSWNSWPREPLVSVFTRTTPGLHLQGAFHYNTDATLGLISYGIFFMLKKSVTWPVMLNTYDCQEDNDFK